MIGIWVAIILLPVPPQAGTPNALSKRAIFLKEKTQGNTVQPHDWNAIADVYDAYEINMAVVEIASQDDFFGETQLPAIMTAFHARNIEVHVLMKAPAVTFNTALWQLNSGRTPVRADTAKAWTCPTNPASLAQALSIIDSILGYNIDGFMFDYIRYNDVNRDCCFCSYCQTAFESHLGHTITDAEWVLNGPYETERLAWRTEPINAWVQTVSAHIKAVKPSVAVSAAVFQGTSTWDPKVEVGQDGAYWVQQGYLDFVAPMVYTEFMKPPMNINAFRTYAHWVRNRYAPNHEVPMVLFIETQAEQTVSVDLFTQTYQVIQETGIDADGFCIFRYGGPAWADILDIRPYLDAITTSSPQQTQSYFTEAQPPPIRASCARESGKYKTPNTFFPFVCATAFYMRTRTSRGMRARLRARTSHGVRRRIFDLS